MAAANGISGRDRKERLLPLLLVAVALAVGLGYLVLYARRIPFYSSPLVDAKIYHAWARAIAGGDWWSRGEGVFYRAPLYPYFLAAVYAIFGRPMPWVPLIQIALGLGVLLLSANLARRLAGERAALWTLALLLLYGPLVATESKLLPTTLGLALHLGALTAALRFSERPAWRRGLAAGALLGLSAWVRPPWILMAVLLPLLLGGRPRPSWGLRIRRWAPFWLGTLLLVAPVTLRNRIVGGDWVLISSNGGMTFFQGNNEENRSGLLTVVRRFELFGSATEQRTLETRVAEREEGRTLTPSQISAFWTRQALAFIVGHPLDWLALEGMKVYRVVTSFEYADNYSYYLERERLWPLRVTFLPFGVLLALGLLGAGLGGGESGPRRLALLSVALGLGSCLAFYVSSRYRMDAVPALAVLGGAGLARLPQWRSLPTRRRSVCVVTAVAVFAASLLPAGGPARSQESITYLQLGNALESQKRFREAEQAYRQSVTMLPANVYAWSTLVLLVERLDGALSALDLLQTAPAVEVGEHPLIFYTRGYLKTRLDREEEAMADFRAALQGNPLMREAHSSLALLYEKRRDFSAAARELEEARALGPGDPDPLAHLAYVYLQTREYAKAREAARALLKLRPKDADASLNLAIASFYLGDLQEAAEILEADSGGEALAVYYRGLLRWRQGRPAEALEDLSRALVLDPQNRRALYYLSLVGGGRGAASGAGRRNEWTLSYRDAYGEEIRAALPLLGEFLGLRRRDPWGTPPSPAEQQILRQMADSRGGSPLAADLQRFLLEEAPAAPP